MRLLVVADTLDGGLGSVAQAHAAAMCPHMEVALAAPASAHSMPGAAFRVYELPLPAAFSGEGRRVAVRALRDLIRELRPDLVHAHGVRSFTLARLSGSRADVTLHGINRPPGERWLRHLGRAAAVRAVPLLAQRAWSVSPDAPTGWTFLPHASPRLTSLAMGAPAPQPEFVWIGRLSNQKRPELLVEAVAALRGSAHGVVYGDGERLAELRSEADRLGADLRFAGHVDDVPAALASARALVLLSHFEGVPLVVQEAMWCGLPVILSPLPGNRWLAGDAALYATDRPSLEAALRRLLDLDEARRLGAAAAEQVRRRISPDMPWPQLLHSYRARP